MNKIMPSKNIALRSGYSYKKYHRAVAAAYKRLLLVFGMMCILLTAFAEEIVIGSWNIRGNGHFEEQDVVQFGSYFVMNNSLDILLQEVKLELLPKQGSNDMYKTIGNNNFLERFAQTLSKQTGSVWKFTSSSEYAIRKNIREYTYCNKGLDNAVLYLINKHMPFKSKQKGWGPWDRDIQVLYRMYQALDSSALIIICGDFNGDARELGATFSDCFVGCRKPTSISAGIFNSSAHYAHEYDHFILNTTATLQVIKEPNRYTSDADISTDRIRYGHKSTTLEYYYEHISDHVPGFMPIDTNL